ncbi:MAG: hypothetical protein KME17_21460 [Cyanosarcina radialis HA8281-LM2]|nr:hypothetical protein [Cyanosarcina radialis HA8281-LM2]
MSWKKLFIKVRKTMKIPYRGISYKYYPSEPTPRSIRLWRYRGEFYLQKMRSSNPKRTIVDRHQLYPQRKSLTSQNPIFDLVRLFPFTGQA